MGDDLKKLLNQLIKLHPKYIDLSLDRVFNLLKKLDNPHLKLPPVIHIAGTNGKGSILSYLNNILQENNYLVHSYISPHLNSIEERFTVKNKTINTRKLYQTLKYIKKINSNAPITFFEITTVAAFYLFSKEKADFVLLETGLGGRLDATNVIKTSIIDIISPISIDHQEFLGKSIKKIANEKLGIIKPSSVVIIGKQKNLVKKHIKSKIRNYENKKLFFEEQYKVVSKNEKYFRLNINRKIYKFHKPNMLGDHQIDNASTAIIGIMQIKKLGYNISNISIQNGLSKTFWPGRLEKFYLNSIPVFLDGAHNVDAAEKIYDYFKYKKLNRWLILGMLKNKDIENYILKLNKIISGIIAIKIPYEKNAFKTNEIESICNKLKIKCIKKNNIKEANKFLINKIKPEEILIAGSLYLVGKVRKIYL